MRRIEFSATLGGPFSNQWPTRVLGRFPGLLVRGRLVGSGYMDDDDDDGVSSLRSRGI